MARFSLKLILTLIVASASTLAIAEPNGAQAVDEAWSKAVAANDINAVMALYSRDAVMWLPDAKEARGQEAIRDAYAALFAANRVTAASFANTRYQTSGDLSVGWGDFKLALSPRNGGSPVSLSGRFSVIAKKEHGKWVYVVDHASAHPSASGQQN